MEKKRKQPKTVTTQAENKEYLHKKLLVLKSYEGSDGSHNHCEVCWARFSKYQCDHQYGYFEPMSSCWICPECFVRARRKSPIRGQLN